MMEQAFELMEMPLFAGTTTTTTTKMKEQVRKSTKRLPTEQSRVPVYLLKLPNF